MQNFSAVSHPTDRPLALTCVASEYGVGEVSSMTREPKVAPAESGNSGSVSWRPCGSILSLQKCRKCKSYEEVPR
ncbi:hypothetical protein E2C01_074526 [Portunus trituberculatus]|uniref:Uncharacterized protein n=1 Tax=Portunus trituberculatus TaxID=210409 RepID=A0A5B7ICP9_PORTR|nr:hypothetical protein [Portunus trituberculatus]